MRITASILVILLLLPLPNSIFEPHVWEFLRTALVIFFGGMGTKVIFRKINESTNTLIFFRKHLTERVTTLSQQRKEYTDTLRVITHRIEFLSKEIADLRVENQRLLGVLMLRDTELHRIKKILEETEVTVEGKTDGTR